jgi:hypothetical protein
MTTFRGKLLFENIAGEGASHFLRCLTMPLLTELVVCLAREFYKYTSPTGFE